MPLKSPEPPRDDRPVELRVLHWNIHSWQDDNGGSNIDAVTNLIRETGPHVVSLVEVDETWGERSALEAVADATGYAAIFAPAFEFGTQDPAGGFGNALLSRLPVRTVRQRQLLWPPRVYDGSEPSESRSVVLAGLDVANTTVWVGSTHLPRADRDARAQALQRLTATTSDLVGPWLLVGDFNVPANSWLDQDSPLRAYPAPAQPTYPTREPVEAIDYCVVPRDLTVEAETLTVTGSDHLPILVRYTPATSLAAIR